MYNCGDNFLFVHVPRTGGKSIYNTLVNEGLLYKSNLREAFEHTFRPEKTCDEFVFGCTRNPFERIVSVYNYLTDSMFKNSTQLSCLKIETSFNDWFTWRYIDKNHSWINRYEKTGNFVKSLPDNMLLDTTIRFYSNFGYDPVLHYFYNGVNAIDVDFIIRYENFKEDWKQLQTIIGSKSDLLHLNKSNNSRSYRDYFNKEMRDVVFDIYKQDFEYFNYDW